MNRAKNYWTIILLMALTMVASAQTRPSPTVVNGYSFITGVDSARWHTSFTQTNVIDQDQTAFTSNANYRFFNQYFSSYVLTQKCGIHITNTTSSHTCDTFPYISSENIGAIWAWRNYATQDSCIVKVDQVDISNNHQLCLWFQGSMDTSDNWTREWQVTFAESDESITLIYGPLSDSSNNNVAIGLQGDTSKLIAIDPTTHTVSSSPLSTPTVANWPGTYRYYKFMPECHLPSQIEVDSITSTSAWIHWNTDSGFWYGVAWDSNGNGQLDSNEIAWTTQNHFQLDSLPEGIEVQAYLLSPCYANDSSAMSPISFSTRCPSFDTRVDYNIYSPSAICQTGTFSNPSSETGIVDYGYSSILSRHTIHCNPEETDPRTGGNLHPVPEGYPASIRLGTWSNGDQQQSITYTLHVDTNDYDLLLIKYALVAEVPDHGPAGNPRFTFALNDSAGNLISDCYYGNFVSSDTTDWIEAEGGLYWLDWSCVGVDLGPLHNQTIQIHFSSTNCAGQVHYGYGYFVLDGATKHLNSTACGEGDTNTLHAPKGFEYYWYPYGHPDQVLSTADTFHTNVAGTYLCDVQYKIGSGDCGFRLTAFVGPHYPKAQFQTQAVDTCPSAIQFTNTSVVALNSDRTRLSEMPCDSYLWDFGDGLTSQETNPIHRYANPGVYTVKLYAYLSNGQCVDSIDKMIIATLTEDHIVDSICQGDSYLFHADTLTEPGEYAYPIECGVEYLHLVERHPSQNHPTLNITCHEGGEFRFDLTDTLYYRFLSNPFDNTLPQEVRAGSEIPDTWFIQPDDSLTLVITTSLYPELICPIFDTFTLFHIPEIKIDLHCYPDTIFRENNEATITDLGDPDWTRIWQVDGQLMEETTATLHYTVPIRNDSLRIWLFANNDYCSDTAYLAIPIITGSPYFPNIFTPDSPNSNGFRGFCDYAKDYQLDIYNKWGDRIFRTHNIEETWDGTVRGVRCPESAYVYVCRYTNSLGQKQRVVGTVVLVR